MRLIDALQEDQWDYFINCIYDCCNELGATDNIQANCLIDSLSNLEIDAESVVRCKDCVHFKMCKYCILDYSDVRMEPDDFCSYGERKEGEANG